MLDINSKISIYTYLLKIDKKIKICPLIWSLVKSASLYLLSLKFDILLKIKDIEIRFFSFLSPDLCPLKITNLHRESKNTKTKNMRLL